MTRPIILCLKLFCGKDKYVKSEENFNNFTNVIFWFFNKFGWFYLPNKICHRSDWLKQIFFSRFCFYMKKSFWFNGVEIEFKLNLGEIWCNWIYHPNIPMGVGCSQENHRDFFQKEEVKIQFKSKFEPGNAKKSFCFTTFELQLYLVALFLKPSSFWPEEPKIIFHQSNTLPPHWVYKLTTMWSDKCYEVNLICDEKKIKKYTINQ